MKDFSEVAGVKVSLNNFKLMYDSEEYPVEQAAREYTDAVDVYLEKNSHKQILYWMYRYFEAKKDRKLFDSFGMEYDLTVIKNGKIGNEYIKTVGHYHSNLKGKEVSYPEVYEVLEGNIQYILQTRFENGKVDVIIVKTEQGDKVIVPPNYGHVSVNVGDTVALSSNIQKGDLPHNADYDSFKENGGAAIYVTDEGVINNPKYKIGKIRTVRPVEKPEFALTKESSLYESFKKNPEKFDFLIHPDKYDFSSVFQDIE